jgi:hypothetical protein
VNAANGIGIVFGMALVAYGLFDKRKKGYRTVEMPLREEEQREPQKPFTRWERILLVGFGIVLTVLGIIGEFSQS